MKSSKSNLVLAFAVMLSFLLVACLHMPLVVWGYPTHDSEWANFALVADDILRGRLWLYPFQQDYGGLGLTYLRAFFVGIAEPLLRPMVGSMPQSIVQMGSHVWTHLLFSHMVTPLLMQGAQTFFWSTFIRSRAIFLLMVFISALGSTYAIYMNGNDFYPACLMLMFIFTGLILRRSTPWYQRSRTEVLSLGILAGFAIYHTSLAVIPVISLLTPWTELRTHWKERLMGRSPMDLSLSAAIGAAFVWMYLEFFSRNLGTLPFGKNGWVRADSKLPFMITCSLAGLWIFKWFPWKKAVLLLVSGFALGNFPQWLHYISMGSTKGHSIREWFEFKQSAQILGWVPERFLELLTGHPDWSQLPGAQQFSILRVGGGVLLIVCAHALLRRSEYEVPFRNAWRFWILGSIFALLKINTWVSDLGPSRYLYLCLIPIWFLVGRLMDQSITAVSGSQTHPKELSGYKPFRGGFSFRTLLLLSLFLLCGHQLYERVQLTNHLQSHAEQLEEDRSLLTAIESLSPEVVLTNDFWKSSRLQWLSAGRIHFWSTWRGWGDPASQQLVHDRENIALLLKAQDYPKHMPNPLFQYEGISWHLEFVNAVGAYTLWRGRKLL